ncbi:MAG: carbohydrate-binding domain family 9 [Verrucomicrobiales bacterium]|nr:carbohydrate-binding domain family 9 [Verrucomicrobiales bacterium]
MNNNSADRLPAEAAPSGAGSADWRELHLPWPDFTTAPPPQPAAPRVRWKTADGFLHWEITCQLPLADRSTFEKSTGFVEGLWEQDLVECFLADSRTGEYVEYNFSPNGHAWWAAHFTAPRVRHNAQPTPESFQPRFRTTWHATGWTAAIRVPLAAPGSTAESASGFDKFNLTAVRHTPEGPLYHSLAALQSGRPDFHLPGFWLPLKADESR